MKIILHDDFGGEHDITEHVRSLYGHVVGSLDWGSGFLSTEEELEVLEVGYLTGFEDGEVEVAIRDTESELVHDRERAKMDARRRQGLFVNDKYWRDQISRKEKYLAGLQAIKESRTRLLALTEDVSSFDE